jgi:stage V sporulation protein S
MASYVTTTATTLNGVQSRLDRPLSILREASLDVIKVSADSRTSAVAGAIAGVIREHKHAEVQAIGAGAVNQAVKALVLATGYLKGDGIDIACVPEFVDVQIEDKVRTAIKLVVDPKPSAPAPEDSA